MPEDARHGGGPWVTASELGDFVYCRRAWYWKRHPESVPPGATYRPPLESFARGDRVHTRIESYDATPTRASRLPYAIGLTIALGLALTVAFWLGWLGWA